MRIPPEVAERLRSLVKKLEDKSKIKPEESVTPESKLKSKSLIKTVKTQKERDRQIVEALSYGLDSAMNNRNVLSAMSIATEELARAMSADIAHKFPDLASAFPDTPSEKIAEWLEKTAHKDLAFTLAASLGSYLKKYMRQ